MGAPPVPPAPLELDDEPPAPEDELDVDVDDEVDDVDDVLVDALLEVC